MSFVLMEGVGVAKDLMRLLIEDTINLSEVDSNVCDDVLYTKLGSILQSYCEMGSADIDACLVEYCTNDTIERVKDGLEQLNRKLPILEQCDQIHVAKDIGIIIFIVE